MLYFLLAVALLFTACNTSDRVKVSATGSIYEVLIVSPNSVMPTVRHTMGEDMPFLPQPEPYFKPSTVTPADFDHILAPSRNILFIDIDSIRYSAVKSKILRDQWSTPQSVYRVQTPNAQAFHEYWSEYGTQVREWFVREEIRRQLSFYEASTNHDLRNRIKKHFACDLWVTNDYMLLMDTTISMPISGILDSASTTFLWMCNNKGSLRRDMVMFSFPYTDDSTFTLSYLNAQRDALLGTFISGQVQGSHMGTEYKVMPPESRILDVDSTYTYEIRGLWKMLDGEAMGGPFVSHTWLDPYNARVVTALVYVFAPGQKKRNPLRQAEAILYSRTQMPNQIKQ